MKKCPSCGMSNSSMNAVCLSCWERLDEVSDDDNLGPAFANNNYGDPMLNANARIMTGALHAKHDPILKPSSILLAGIFIVLVLVLGGAYTWALLALLVTIGLAGYFHLSSRSNRSH